MRIYRLFRVIPVGYNSIGEMVECIVIAAHEHQARQIASQEHQREEDCIWTDSSTSSCILIGNALEHSWARLICSDITCGGV
jgi:hypothetical protein